MIPSDRYRVGYVLTKRIAVFDLFREYASSRGIEFVKLDIGNLSQDHGLFDIIIHKVTKLLISSDHDDGDKLAQFEAFLAQHPESIVIDPLEYIRPLVNRGEMLKMLEKSRWAENSTEALFYLPKSTIVRPLSLETVLQSGLKFPLVCKPIAGSASVHSHQILLIPSAEAFAKCLSGELEDYVNQNQSCLLQEFVNHDGIIFKAFVVGNKSVHLTRPSMKNVKEDDNVHIFDSQRIPKSFAWESDFPSKPETWDTLFETSPSQDMLSYKNSLLSESRLNAIATSIGRRNNLTLFGFDIIIESSAQKLYIVDINYFPGYDNVPDFNVVFLKTLLDKLQTRSQVNGFAQSYDI